MKLLHNIFYLKCDGHVVVKYKFNNHNQQFHGDFPNNTSNLSPFLTLPYIGTPSIKCGKRIAVLFHDRLGTDIEIAY